MTIKLFLLHLQGDEKMDEIMTLAHTFLQYFCKDNIQNQALLHKHLNLFLTPGVSFIYIYALSKATYLCFEGIYFISSCLLWELNPQPWHC